jgi:hypothetical protein
MNALTLVIILLIRAILPISLLIIAGEWIHRREANYWIRK